MVSRSKVQRADMDAKQLLLELRDIVRDMDRRLEALVQLEPDHTCKVCGQPLTCNRCAGRKGGLTTSRKYTIEQRREMGKTGGRPRKDGGPPRKRELIPDPVTGASVPVRKAQPATRVEPLGIDPTKCYKPEEVAQLLRVAPATLKHWRSRNKGPLYKKLDGHFIRYSGIPSSFASGMRIDSVFKITNLRWGGR